MTYVQYFNAPDQGREKWGVVEACGDRAVVVLDGRKSINNLINDAHSCNGMRRPKYPAFRIMKGRSFLDSQPISGIIHI